MYNRKEIIILDKNINIHRMRKDIDFYQYIYEYCIDMNLIEIDINNNIQLFWHYKNNVQRLKCECGKNTNFDLPNFKYFNFCSRKCSTKSKTTQQKLKDTCFKKYGTETFMSNSDILEKRKKTCINRYGTENVMQDKSIKEKTSKTKLNFSLDKKEKIKNKTKNTTIEKYGVEYIFQSSDVKNKIRDTCLDKYNFTSATKNEDVKRKREISNIEKYGVKHISQLSSFRKKVEETCIKKYGVRNVMQNSDIFSKKTKLSFIFKEYILPSGKKIKVQGREPEALDILLKKYQENDIVISTKEINDIIGLTKYIGLDNKEHIYYPDFYIISENKVIEVKSNWTYNLHLENNLLKEKAIKDKDINFEFMIIK